MYLMRRTLILLTLMLLPAPLWAADAKNPSGFPVPRYVSLKSDEVNVRTGPGQRYPIQWVVRRESLPVEIIEEFDHWRKIKMQDGTAGWVHKTMLDGARTVLFSGKESCIVRAAPEADAAPVLKAESGVIGKLVACQKSWCRVQVATRKGWVQKSHIWGVYMQEQFEK